MVEAVTGWLGENALTDSVRPTDSGKKDKKEEKTKIKKLSQY